HRVRSVSCECPFLRCTKKPFGRINCMLYSLLRPFGLFEYAGGIPECAKVSKPARRSFIRRRLSSIKEALKGQPCPTSCGRQVWKKVESTATSTASSSLPARLSTTPGNLPSTNGSEAHRKSAIQWTG